MIYIIATDPVLVPFGYESRVTCLKGSVPALPVIFHTPAPADLPQQFPDENSDS